MLIEVAAVGICGSDVHYFEHGRIGPYVVSAPMVVGHEASGTIVAVGSSVTPDRIGERVAIEPGVPDGTCTTCRRGNYNLCPHVRFFATPPVDGAITRHVTVDSAFAHVVPDDVSLEQAALAEPVSVGVWAARKAAVSSGDRVLVTGAGPIGILAAQVARAFGARDIVLTDTSAYRLDVAAGLGFSTLIAGTPFATDFDVFLECSGSQRAFADGFAAMAPLGRIVLVGMGADALTIDVPALQGRELSLTGIFRYANTYPLALRLIADGEVDVDAIVTHRFSLSETEAALTLSSRTTDALKAVVLPGRD